MAKRRFDLEGKVVAVTGASRGIGLALAHAYGSRGARLALVARDTGALDRLHAELDRSGVDSAVFACDIARAADRIVVVEKVHDRFSGIDVLVNNAGVSLLSPVVDLDENVLAEVMAVNFFAPLSLSQLVLPEMLARGAGQVVFVSSVAAMRALPGLGGYAASKAALAAIADALRVELRGSGVDVINVSPGKTDTTIVASARGPGGGRRPLERLQPTMSPEQVAEAIVRASQRRAARVTLGAGAHLIEWVQRLSPGLTDRLAARSMERPR